ncbi:hypothetical protein Ahy_A04g018778 isoform A [Arachis hypogaea]|uniref:Uncharacterized protein n=1 Tax=Arachis hypogaea TaxID=3818 RepID=A0A445DEL3_ARAHY|nr:hypothetical protein Ahy_A04g018778 isoform A [Arachis hypogaea]
MDNGHTYLLNAEILDDTYLFDMIAEVVGKEDPRNLVTSTGKKTKRMAVTIKYHKASLCFQQEQQDWVYFVWGDEGSVEPFIVVLLLFKASWWNGKITVQSHFYISKIHIERDLKEVVSFKNRLLSGAPLNSIRISHLSSQETWSVADELKQGSVGVKTIEETLNDAEVAACWIAATIVSINAGKNDWFYKALESAQKKLKLLLLKDMNLRVMDTQQELPQLGVALKLDNKTYH